VLARALDPFPVPVRTLDALHLASALFLGERGQEIAVASYDEQFVRAGKALGLEVVPLD
jgi:predicted nucleic acid-binding protein